MDGIDAKLLNILSENSNVTATEITQKVNLSIPAINKRISKLTQRGIIRQFTILVDNKMAGKPIQAFILIVVQPNSAADKLTKYVQSDPDILECYAVTGEYDYLLKVCAKDVEGLEDKLLHLKRQLGVIKSHTMLSLLEHKFQPSAMPDMPEKNKDL